MHNTTANSNRASSSDGGTIYINSQGSTDSRVSITNCQFINNSANLGVEEHYMNQYQEAISIHLY